jgi:hypothetical protein
MRFSRMTLGSAGVFAVVGTGIFMSLSAFTSAGVSLHRSVLAASDISCKDFLESLNDDFDSDATDDRNAKVKLFRTEAWFEDISTVVNTPKWIGAVRIGNKESDFFPDLPPNAMGCVRFQAYGAEEGAAKLAELWDSDNVLKHSYSGKVLCIGYKHAKDVKPERVEHPKNCDSYKIWIQTKNGPYYREWPEPGAPKPLMLMPFIGVIKQGLDSLKLEESEVKMILDKFATPGPWFPCASTGCCRVFL